MTYLSFCKFIEICFGVGVGVVILVAAVRAVSARKCHCSSYSPTLMHIYHSCSRCSRCCIAIAVAEPSSFINAFAVCKTFKSAAKLFFFFFFRRVFGLCANIRGCHTILRACLKSAVHPVFVKFVYRKINPNNGATHAYNFVFAKTAPKSCVANDIFSNWLEVVDSHCILYFVKASSYLYPHSDIIIHKILACCMDMYICILIFIFLRFLFIALHHSLPFVHGRITMRFFCKFCFVLCIHATTTDGPIQRELLFHLLYLLSHKPFNRV